MTSTSLPPPTTSQADNSDDDDDDDDDSQDNDCDGRHSQTGNGHAGKKDEGEKNDSDEGVDSTAVVGERDKKEEEEEEEEEEVDLSEVYAGCFMLESRHKRGKGREFLYTPGSKTCPLVTASRVTWPETRHGNTRSAPCKKGNGESLFFVWLLFGLK